VARLFLARVAEHLDDRFLEVIMNTALLPRPLLADPPEPYDGMPVSEADYWEF
jgi:hypothetical protein